ncbi:MAG: hypothetical protein ABJA93_11265 [Sporichthyaceae bacterium]
MPEDFDLDGALDHLASSTRTAVRPRSAEDIRALGERRRGRRTGAMTAAAALAVVAVVAGVTYVSLDGSTHRNAPPAQSVTPTPSESPVGDAADFLALDQLPAVGGPGSWRLLSTGAESGVADPPHSCSTQPFSALDAAATSQRDWAWTNAGGSDTHLRQVVATFPDTTKATTAVRLSYQALDGCTPTGLQNGKVQTLADVPALGADGTPRAGAQMFRVSGAVSDTDGRFEYVSVIQSGTAVSLLVFTHSGPDSNYDPPPLLAPSRSALQHLAVYGDGWAGPDDVATGPPLLTESEVTTALKLCCNPLIHASASAPPSQCLSESLVASPMDRAAFAGDVNLVTNEMIFRPGGSTNIAAQLRSAYAACATRTGAQVFFDDAAARVAGGRIVGMTVAHTPGPWAGGDPMEYAGWAPIDTSVVLVTVSLTAQDNMSPNQIEALLSAAVSKASAGG